MLIDSLRFALERSECLDGFWSNLDAGDDGTLGIANSARPFMVAARFSHKPQSTLAVVAGEDAAVSFARSLSAYLGEDKVLRFPERADLPFDKKHCGSCHRRPAYGGGACAADRPAGGRGGKRAGAAAHACRRSMPTPLTPLTFVCGAGARRHAGRASGGHPGFRRPYPCVWNRAGSPTPASLTAQARFARAAAPWTCTRET